PGSPDPESVPSEIEGNGDRDHLDQVSGEPTLIQAAAFTKRWQSIQQSLQGFATQTGKPILITELGYPCLPWALKDPWNYVHDAETPVTPNVQAMGYRAFTDNWQHLIKPNRPIPTSGFAGVMFYTWDPYNGGLKDPGYGVWGKPAQTIVRNWLTPLPAD
ncbi:MAG: hypothetical protein JKX85_16440, partial [Phycisphaeraceae bacterium]|nr:hypothetical protein [Phycisphaeraceae bacterium]